MPRAILVTGCSSGIGLRLTERLALLGHRVYATLRGDRDLRVRPENVIPVRLDLRDPRQIEDAARLVERSEGALWGLVNNAGVGGIGPVVAWTDAELDDLFAVNALGPVRMSRVFLPLLLAARGRIVNVGSQGGSISKKYFGPYTMTKHALEAFTIALDEEVAPFGMRVSIVQPGGVATSIGEKSARADLARFRRAPPPFDAEARGFVGMFEAVSPRDSTAGTAPDPHDPQAAGAEEPESETNRKPSPPDLVVDAVLHALFDPEPRRRYLVGTRWEGDRVINGLIDRLADANDCPALGYPHEELVARLEARLNAGRRTSEGGAGRAER